MKKNDTEQYINMPIWFIKMTSHKGSPIYLTPFERELYMLIFGLCSNNICFATDSYFADVFKVTVKHVNKSIQKLADKDLLIIEHENHKRLISTGSRKLYADVPDYYNAHNEDYFYITTETDLFIISKSDYNAQ